ncbi:MAG: sigma 54-interacting transcriptional regulator, partial [Bacteroidota bacterium]|nr:sigma 54-interacting transcriptional regulator [Bacteroidota bacterium]
MMKKEELNLLLSINEAIAKTRDSETLFKNIFEKLLRLCKFKIAGTALLNRNKTYVEMFLKGIDSPNDNLLPLDLHTNIPLSIAPLSFSLEHPVTNRLNINDYSHTAEFKKNDVLAALIKKHDIEEIIDIPLLIGGELIGFLVLAYSKGNSPKSNEIIFLEQAANQIAVLLSVIMGYEAIYRSEKYKEIQLELTNTFVSIKERDKLFKKFAIEINKLLSINYISISFSANQDVQMQTISFIKDKTDNFSEMLESSKLVPLNLLKPFLTGKSGYRYFEFTDDAFLKLCKQSTHFKYLRNKKNITSVFYINYCSENKEEINLVISKDGKKIMPKLPYMEDITNFDELEIDLCQELTPQLLLILNNYFVYEEVDHLRKNLEQEKLFLLDEINLANSFQQIIGNSPAIHIVHNKIKQVAPLDATVLIQGETGTGKELAAKAIHNLSNRNDKAFIKINCAALPAQLIESELFGHEKGSFTGAIEKRLGKFELANHGTIFLDEIGEMPLELQPKLLRVLQEQQFERIGGSSTLYTDVRVIAATNRNLEKEVELGNFRADLFFRLNVFPLIMP